jgi:hypothetical protein
MLQGFKISSVFYLGFTREGVKRHFLISNVSMVKTVLCHRQLVACEVELTLPRVLQVYQPFGDRFYCSLQSTAVPSVWLSTDHLCSLWCKELVFVIIRYLFDIVNLTTKQVSTNVQERNAVLRYHLLQVLWNFYMLFTLENYCKVFLFYFK